MNIQPHAVHGAPRTRLRGVALVISLIILFVLALLGVSTMSTTTMQLRIASDTEMQARSFQAAEAGVAAAMTLAFDDPGMLIFEDDSAVVNFAAMDPNPLSHMGQDIPAVTVVVSGDRVGSCERSERASSSDIIGCSAFDLVSTHASGGADVARNAATTTLRLGISQQIIAEN
ncbi:MAG TPA: hypothetical protein DDY14_12505 [Chromatiaceae bacterium]|jgi:hypothetical protein|nr:MAG: hypothetical protein N838_24775 [Thiohalocapsa sp. PB-PSB1]QQO52575.1 MAG: hypothetical protein N838_03520 [Thiohalocapsa sp. PB-PSB1]HBG96100.1 hypothetical protein [Chromatiaceae bacterium]HCS91489.1 hypothetical protein [Chromatiaceae bacterium]